MSLEAAIQENTSALRELIAQLKAGAPITAVVEKAEQPAKEATKTAKSPAPAPAAKEEKAEALTQMNGAEATAALHGHANEPKEPTYQDAAKAVTDLAKAKGRAAAEEVLKQFGAAKLPEVKAEDFAAVITACAAAQEA